MELEQFATMHRCETHDEWLKARRHSIGSSDASAILGANPWKTNEQLWEEKVGIVKPKELFDNPLVIYGTDAEAYLRKLFALDYPQYTVMYVSYNLWRNKDRDFLHASLDGWLKDRDGRYGVLEIKTATIASKAQKEKWTGTGIPQYYYIQVLHELLVTGFDFAILKAQLKYEREGEEPFLQTKHYHIERADVEADLEFLFEKELEFYGAITKKERPNTVLPEI